MSLESIYNYETGESNLVKDERYKNVGSSTFQLGTIKRAFIEEDFAIQLNDSNGTELIEDVDFEFTNKDSEYTSLEGVNVWTGITILNSYYETGVLYITYRALGSYTDGDFVRDLRDDVDTNTADIAALATTVETATKTADYTILDDDGVVLFYVDGTGATVDLTLPTLADNQDRFIRVVVIDDTNLCSLTPEGAETIEGMSTIELPKEGNHITVIGQASEWKIINENISCMLWLNTYAGYGSTDNKIERFTTVVENYGNLFTENHVSGYAANAEGLEITIAKPGRYSITATCHHSATVNFGISLNSSQLTTEIASITAADRVAMTQVAASPPYTGVYPTLDLAVGDIIRPHTSGGALGTGNSNFIITYLGS